MILPPLQNSLFFTVFPSHPSSSRWGRTFTYEKLLLPWRDSDMWGHPSKNPGKHRQTCSFFTKTGCTVKESSESEKRTNNPEYHLSHRGTNAQSNSPCLVQVTSNHCCLMRLSIQMVPSEVLLCHAFGMVCQLKNRTFHQMSKFHYYLLVMSFSKYQYNSLYLQSNVCIVHLVYIH